MHHTRVLVYGTPGEALPRRRMNGEGSITGAGYKQIRVDGRYQLEHRVIMERALGRRLLRCESVHHKNGNRLDNALENLELWSSSHPSGQRVDDKITWAIELLRLYAPELLK